MNKVLLLLSLLLVSSVYSTNKFELFQTFMSEHNKMYDSIIVLMNRFKIFENNLLRFKQIFGEDHPSKNFSVFFDLSEDEFNQRLNLKIDQEEYDFLPKYEFTSEFNAPDSKDWRDNKVVTPVKDQGNCGSCWAFSAVGNLESINILAGNKEIILSEQQLVDCDKKDHGCKGGLMENAYNYIINAGGLQSTSDYPYTALDGSCKFNKSQVKVQVESFHKIEEKEESLKEAVDKVGPISVAVNATYWQLYKGGIFNISYCPKSLNHGVLVVGYGTDDKTGLDYWIIKNSWGTIWGDNGYIKLARNKNQLCGISTYNITAKVKKN